MGEGDLEDDAETTAQQDIVFMKEDQKFVVQDLEQMEHDKKEMKRKRREAFEVNSDDESSDEDAGKKNTATKRKAQEQPSYNTKNLGKLQGMSASQAMKQVEVDKKA